MKTYRKENSHFPLRESYANTYPQPQQKQKPYKHKTKTYNDGSQKTPNWCGIPGITYIWKEGEDAQLEYQGKRINFRELHDAYWKWYQEDAPKPRGVTDMEYEGPLFHRYLKSNAKDIIDYIQNYGEHEQWDIIENKNQKTEELPTTETDTPTQTFANEQQVLDHIRTDIPGEYNSLTLNTDKLFVEPQEIFAPTDYVRQFNQSTEFFWSGGPENIKVIRYGEIFTHLDYNWSLLKAYIKWIKHIDGKLFA